MKKIRIYWTLLFGILCIPNILLAQKEPNEVVMLDNGFQDNFFEALKQKGIENYDKAIESLLICKEKEPENTVIYIKLGKNYLV